MRVFLVKNIGMKNVPEYIEWSKLNIYSKTTHAEMVAVLQILKKNKLSRDSNNKPKFPKILFIFSFNKNKKTRMSKPCADCVKILRYYGVKKVIYSTPEGVISEEVCNTISLPSRGNRS